MVKIKDRARIRDTRETIKARVLDTRQRILARCYVAISEIDYDLAKWRDEVSR
jgi:hypothetical protein